MEKSGKGAKYPDGLWLYRKSDKENGIIVVEVGHYDLDSGWMNYPVLHISFEGQISVVNPDDSFVMDVGYAIKQYRDMIMNADLDTAGIEGKR